MTFNAEPNNGNEGGPLETPKQETGVQASPLENAPRDYESLKTDIGVYRKNILQDPTDGGYPSAEYALRDATAIMESTMTKDEKKELLELLRSSVASQVLGGSGIETLSSYASRIQERPVDEEILSSLVQAGKDAAYSGKMESFSPDSVKGLSGEDQEALAEAYFDKTIGEAPSNNKFAYEVYLKLKGTSFGNKFLELENARLQRAGHGPMTI